ncbi:flagellar protein export ATPase FliI [Leifsonia xyli subsp. xyli]|uniref:Flagellum-like ATP synthase n=2 Tax=Leifsonia xyli subsp. xyli TaxID=59736 RepID=Q6AGA5_LEIXX|nr:FliI/YscN family ATPase [Leifsonia xyli]AAT88590.1 flagellum-like ATP synthase [Leifsonia xyli subsp. xyli str. CTCB07]ODA90532.1 flagellar protein export ATPase FliI [Leifsonia xyli subsp. xyli]
MTGYRPGADRYAAALRVAAPERVGAVTSAVGLSLTVAGLRGAVGDLVEIGEPGSVTHAQIVAVGPEMTCMPMTPAAGHSTGAGARFALRPPTVPTGRGLLGRVINGLGHPIDGKGPLDATSCLPLDNAVPNPLDRARIDTPLPLGVRALDTLIPVGRGQRLGLFAGSGVGKSSLLSMIARGTDADVFVLALIGERGREVREFLEDDLGADGLARSVVVVATSDEPALMRRRAAFAATRIAESFRDNGADAMLMMDSLTRVAMAQREIGLSAGEPPATRGYPSSTFSTLASLLERAGTAKTGSITGLYTVLVDGDDHNEPIADAARSILDGHVLLDRKLAINGHFPSIDVLGSISRLAGKICTPGQQAAATALRKVMAARRAAQDLLDVGAYKPGANPLVDAGVEHEDRIAAFLQQGMGEQTTAEAAWTDLGELVTGFGGFR